MSKKNKKAEPSGPKSVQNRKARFEYSIIDEYEAGMVLHGSEVKSLYAGKANLTDAYCRVIDGEVWLLQLDIEPYSHTSMFQPERRRDRKLLLHKKEILVLDRKMREKGFSIIPLEIYFRNGKAKVKIALATGKSNYDKRQTIADKDHRRELERARSGRL